eukprot:m.348854 g.348854  ORF g.348854 m.348854 type:complete len:527 (-) comp16563_c2_seq12:6737-8317(-)
MKINSNTCLYGGAVVLLPYLPAHVSRRQQWLAESSANWVDRTLKESPTRAAEVLTQKKFLSDPRRCVFMVADAEMHADPEVSEADALIGEAHLLLVDDENDLAVVEIMILDRSVRRRALVCEALLLVMLYGAETLMLSRFAVNLDENASPTDNRVVFAARAEEECGDGVGVDASSAATAAPPPDEIGGGNSPTLPRIEHATDAGVCDEATADRTKNESQSTPKGRRRSTKGSSVAPRIKKALSSVKKAFSRKKTDHLSKLTRHLHKVDEGDHWPHELDFELVGPCRLELELGPEALKALTQFTSHTKRMKYSTIVPGGTMRRGRNTRIDGRTVVCVPYTKKHVGLVQRWMENPAMYTAFGVAPPTLKSEQRAQNMMEKDKACHAFVVCSKVDIGREECPVHPEGRAQIVVVAPSVAQIAIGMVHPDLARRAFLLREVLVMLLVYARTVMNVSTITMVSATAVRPVVDPKGQLWSTDLDFVDSEGASACSLDLSSEVVKSALRSVSSGIVVREFVSADVVYEEGTMT